MATGGTGTGYGRELVGWWLSNSGAGANRTLAVWGLAVSGVGASRELAIWGLADWRLKKPSQRVGC